MAELSFFGIVLSADNSLSVKERLKGQFWVLSFKFWIKKQRKTRNPQASDALASYGNPYGIEWIGEGVGCLGQGP